MAKEYIVKRAERKLKRDINKVFSGNFLKIITEIVLNSDDSYKRIETRLNDLSVKDIIIDINRKKKTVVVIDYAEGLNSEDFHRIFTEYGAQHNTEEETVRGLFGQGASDVLFFGAQSSKLGQIQSIKDGLLHVCKFIIADEQKIKIQTISNKQQIVNFKEKYNINENGTVVTFGLGEQVSIPHKSQIKDKLERFYMLRYVLADSKRNIVLKHDKIKNTLSSKQFITQDTKPLLKESFNFKYKDKTLKGTLILYEDEHTESEEKVFIIDNRERVYDNTLFGLEETSGASRIKGTLIFEDLYECLTDYLNQDQPEEILRDSRDGFDQRQDFTKRLFAQIKPIILHEVKKLNNKYEPRQFSMDKDKLIMRMLKKINAFYKELRLEEIGNLERGSEPPGDGLKFVREKIFITKKKIYDLKLLINPNLISSEETINLNIDHNQYLDLITKTINYKEKDIDENGLVTKSVVIKAMKETEIPLNLTADVNNYHSNTLIHVVEENIVYPENGLEFIPKETRVKPNKSSILHLFIDTSKFPINTIFEIERYSKSELVTEMDSYTLLEEHLINEGIAHIPIQFRGGNLNETHHFQAKSNDTIAKAIVRVEEPKESEKGLEGLFSGLEAEYDSTASWQSKYTNKTGKITINASHVINKTLLNDISIEALKQSNYTKEQYNYIFELVCYECAKQIVNIKLEKNEIEEQVEVVQQEIQKYKTELYKSIMSE